MAGAGVAEAARSVLREPAERYRRAYRPVDCGRHAMGTSRGHAGRIAPRPPRWRRVWHLARLLARADAVPRPRPRSVHQDAERGAARRARAAVPPLVRSRHLV